MKNVLVYKRILFKIIGKFAREVKKGTNFVVRLRNLNQNGSVAQLYSASDFGSEGWGLESLRGHKEKKHHFRDAFSFKIKC